jgi:hypothetical protein
MKEFIKTQSPRVAQGSTIKARYSNVRILDVLQLLGASGTQIIWSPFKPTFFKIFRPRRVGRIFLRDRA